MRPPVLVLLACLAVTLPAPGALAAPRTHAVSGTWQEVVPVSMTSYTPSAGDPLNGQYQGVGSTLWQGTWTGVTHYTMQGTANLVTGAGSGTLQETFVGRSTDGGTGTLDFSESYTVAVDGTISIQARIVGGTGDFAGARGSVDFLGHQYGVATGNGTYSGRWSHA